MKHINNVEDNKSNLDNRVCGPFADLHSSTLVLEPHHYQFNKLVCSRDAVVAFTAVKVKATTDIFRSFTVNMKQNGFCHCQEIIEVKFLMAL